MAFRQQHVVLIKVKMKLDIAANICKTGFNIQLTIYTLNTACEMRGHGSNASFPPRIWFSQS